MAATRYRLLHIPKQCCTFYRNFFTNLGNNLGRHAVQTEEDTHVYKQSMNNRDVIDYLIKNVVFENEDWIITNKPYGVGLAKPSNFLPRYNPRTFTDVYLREILPLVAQELEVSMLEVVLMPERFTSGVTILGKTSEAVEKFKELSLQDLKRGALPYSFIAVTLFEPVPGADGKKFKLQFNKEKRTVEVVNKKKKLTGAVINCRHEMIASSKFCSLVKVEANKMIYNCVSEYLEKACLSPVLGEVMFNSSVAKIGDISFPVVADGPARDSKNLDQELLSQLKLHESEISLIPKHLHLKSFKLKMGKSEEFFVSVPLPNSFVWTCECLNLSVNKNN